MKKKSDDFSRHHDDQRNTKMYNNQIKLKDHI